MGNNKAISADLIKFRDHLWQSRLMVRDRVGAGKIGDNRIDPPPLPFIAKADFGDLIAGDRGAEKPDSIVIAQIRSFEKEAMLRQIQTQFLLRLAPDRLDRAFVPVTSPTRQIDTSGPENGRAVIAPDHDQPAGREKRDLGPVKAVRLAHATIAPCMWSGAHGQSRRTC